MNSSAYQSIVESNVRPSVWQLTLGLNLVIDQDNDPKHNIESTTEWLLQWFSQISDLISIVMLQAKYPQTSMNWTTAAKKNGPNFLHNDAWDS